MNIKTTVVCLPVQQLDKTLTFYKQVFGLSDIQIDDGMITVELPKLSLFLMGTNAFETYSRKVGRGALFPKDGVATIISCAVMTKDDVDSALANATKYGGTVTSKASVDETFGGYVGYISDPDGHLWELVYPRQNS